MAFVGKPRDEEQYGRLMGMIAPEATPSKRVGTEAPTGAPSVGPSANKGAEEFTKAGAAPGAAFQRQLQGANIGGITKLAEQPLLREAGQEATRVAQEGLGYKTAEAEKLKSEPQFSDFGQAVEGVAKGDEKTTGTAQNILTRSTIPTTTASIADVKEFTPLQALRGGSVESLLRKEATGPYTTGMAGLDALLFQKKGGAADLATKGVALRATEQAAADALEKKLTEEAQANAAKLVESQRTGLVGALTGKIDPMLAGYQAGIDPLKQGRMAASAQQNQAMIDYYNTLSAPLKEQFLQSYMASVLPQVPAGEEVEYVPLSGDYNNLPAAPGSQIPFSPERTITEPDIAAIQAAVQGVDIQSIIQGMLQGGQPIDPTLADVAALNPEQAQQYQRLVGLLGMAPGQDISQYSLGKTTEALEPSTKLSEDQVRATINQALQAAATGVPLKTTTIPAGPTTTSSFDPYEAARRRAGA